MKALKSILIFIITTVVLVNTSCFSNGSIENKLPKLKIAVMEYDIYLRTAIEKFNEVHKDCTIEEKIYYNDQYEKYSEDIQTCLSDCSGQDIIVTSPDRIPMLSKYIDNASFSELDDLYNNDKSLEKDDYYNEIMNYGIYKSKRYLVPLSYTIDGLFTSKSILEDNGIKSLDKELSWEDISQAAESYKKLAGKKYLLSNLSFSSILKEMGINVDVENKTSQISTVRAINALKIYKSIYKYVLPASKLNKKESNGDLSSFLKDGDILFENSSISSPQNLWNNYSSFNSEVQPEVYAVRDINNKVPAKVDLFAAINKRCTNKKEAYEFISMLLSKEYQSESALYGIPVCKSAYEKKKEMLLKGSRDRKGSQTGRGGGLKTNDSISMLLTQIDEVIPNLRICKIEDNKINAIIDYKVFEGISKNEKDENILMSLQEEVDRYFKEGLKLTADKKGNTSDINNEKASLSIYYMDYERNVKSAIRRSNEIYPDIKIVETASSIKDLENIKKKLSTELMAGEGPDIILLDTFLFKSISRALDSGIFTDLNGFINEDKDFNRNDYFLKVFDAGIWNNKRLFLPLSFSIPYFITTDSTLKRNNIVIGNENLTLESLSKLAKSLAQGKNKNLVDNGFLFKYMMDISGIQFVDNKLKKSHFNTKEFIKLIEEYKDIYASVATYDDCKKYSSCAEMIKDDKIVFEFENNNESPGQLLLINSKYKSVTGDEMNIVPIVNNEVCYANISKSVGINTNCKNKDAAFKFIKIMLSKDLQKAVDSYGNNNINLCLPINKQAYIEDMKLVMSKKGLGFTSEFPLVPLPKRLVDKMNTMLEKVQPIQNIDVDIMRIVSEELKNYIKGVTSAKQTAKDIDEKVTLYLGE